jgi:uncharacterized protein (TIGR02145 family)
MRTNATLSLFLCLLITVPSFCGEIEDQDGNIYKTVKIGNQEWIAGNLNVSTFRNGYAIPEAKTDEEWISLGNQGKPAWCYYQNNPENGKKFGKLYNWHAVNDPGGLCPAGWHVPTDDDWAELVGFLGGRDLAGGKLKDTTFWLNPNTGATNETGFSALPGNFRYPVAIPEGLRRNNGSFWRYQSRRGLWWSSTEEVTNTAWGYYLLFGDSSIGRSYYEKKSGFSVRCVRD